MFQTVGSSTDQGSMARKCAHSVISSANPGSSTRKCTHLIEAEDEDDIVMKWSRDGNILTNLEPKVRARDVRQAEDLLGMSESSGVSSIEQIERAIETGSLSSPSSSSNADAIPSQVTLVMMPCKSRVEVPKMQGQTLVKTQLSQAKAPKIECRDILVRTPSRVKFPERR